jgi:hypothetical protein
MKKFVLPVILVVVIIISVVILGGLASGNPDGFEWTLFEFAGVPEPEGGFGGIWSFLGEGAAIEVATGVFGILFVLVLGYLFFLYSSRRSE